MRARCQLKTKKDGKISVFRCFYMFTLQNALPGVCSPVETGEVARVAQRRGSDLPRGLHFAKNDRLFGQKNTVVQFAYAFEFFKQIFNREFRFFFAAYVVYDFTGVHHYKSVAVSERVVHVMRDH